MPDAESPTPFRATLISTPWALFNRPSLQLAALKAYLERETDAEIETCHLYLDLAAAIGCDTYRRISEAGWAGEALFAPLVFPERHQQAAKVFRRSLRKTAGVAGSPILTAWSAASMKPVATGWPDMTLPRPGWSDFPSASTSCCRHSISPA